MANTMFSVQYLILSQAPIKEKQDPVFWFHWDLLVQGLPGLPVVNLFPVSSLLETLSWLTNVFQNKETPRLLGIKGEVKPQTSHSHSWAGASPQVTVSNQLWEVGKSIYLGFDFLPSSPNVHNRETWGKNSPSSSVGYSGVSLWYLKLQTTWVHGDKPM